MEARLLHEDKGIKTFVVIFKQGDQVTSGLTEFARTNHLTGAHFTGIGAFEEVTLAWFDPDSKQYRKNHIGEQVELVSLMGDISVEGNEPKVHAHAVVAKSDGSAMGGHLMEARVRPTLELIVTDTEKYLLRRHDQASGLALIDLDAVCGA